MEALTRATFKQKETDNIPKDVKILSKEVSITVEEIENGFLICKTSNIKYQKKDKMKTKDKFFYKNLKDEP